jgi:hypothetical protein
LKNGRAYQFQVQCYNANGAGDISAFSNSVTPEPKLPEGWRKVAPGTDRFEFRLLIFHIRFNSIILISLLSFSVYYYHEKTKQAQWNRPDTEVDKGNFNLPGETLVRRICD